MYFSLWNFKEWYERCGIDLSYQISSNAPSVSLLQYSSVPDAEFSNDEATVLPGDLLRDCSGFHSVLLHGSERILFPIASPMEISNQGNRMIRYFTNWENKLAEGIMDDFSPSHLFRIIHEEFPFPFAILLPNGTIYQRTDDWKMILSDDDLGIILKTAQRTSGNAPFCRSFIFNTAHSFMLGTLKSLGKPIAYFIAYEDTNRFQPGHITLAYSIINILETNLRFHSGVNLGTHPLSGWFQQSIKTPANYSLEILSQLNSLHWKAEDYYQLFAVTTKADHSTAALSDLYLHLSVSNCCAFFENALYILDHYSGSYASSVSSLQIEAFRNASLCTGISLPFRGLDKLHLFCRQALTALELAQNTGENIIWTEKILPETILENCAAIPDVHSLIHPDILALADADSRNRDSLRKTLYTYYVQGRSMVRTSNAMFIHRNTLRNRLEKIQSIVSLNIEEPEAQRQYLLSLILQQNLQE